MSLDAYALLGLTAIVAALVAVVVYAVLRFSAAAREARTLASGTPSESTFMASAVQEAVTRLRGQEREMQARAEASERLSEQIVTSLTSGLLLVGADERLRLVNPAGRRLLGLAENVSGNYREVLAGAPALREAIAGCLRNGEPVLRRTVSVGADPVTHLGLTLSPVVDGRGHALSVIALFTDLTAVLALEEQVRLKDSLARLGELTAGIAHEFRNGLATIHGYARMIEPQQLPPPYPSYVEGIRHETEALGRVVTNFLNFARPAPPSLSSVDLRALLERLADEVGGEAGRLGGHVTVSGDFGRVDGDEVLLRQAFSNLLRNAFDACAEVARPPHIEVSGDMADDGRARVLVNDNGPGIDPSALPRIFQPFVTTRNQGTGLGLALVQKIVVTHNGRVTAANREGGGASFEVSLPLARAARG